MNTLKSVTPTARLHRLLSTLAILSLLIAGCSDSETTSTTNNDTPPQPERSVLQGNDLNNLGSSLLSLNPDGPGGSPNQSLRSGDVLQGDAEDNVMIGALGVDVMFAGDGDDVMIGGTEDFNANVDGDNLGSDNRDRAFGEAGDDLFIWTPGDGSDFYDGGTGVDVVAFGVLGEERDNAGNTDGAPFFNVSPPGTNGSFNFDGIFLDANTRLPILSVSTSPGFCTVLDYSTHPAELAALSLDHVVRFSLRGIANAFDDGSRSDDDGLRVALSLRNVEYLVCTNRAVVDGAGDANIQVLDISDYPPTVASLSDLPLSVQQQIQ